MKGVSVTFEQLLARPLHKMSNYVERLIAANIMDGKDKSEHRACKAQNGFLPAVIIHRNQDERHTEKNHHVPAGLYLTGRVNGKIEGAKK